MAQRWKPEEVKKLLLAIAASAAALFVNPFGYKLVLYPFDFLFRQPGAMQRIAEWRPVDFSTGDGKLALIVILALLACALFSSRRWRLDEVLLTAFALWAALSHARFLFFAGLIIVPILAPRLELFPPYERELDKPWLNAFIMATIVGALIFFFPSEKKLQQKVDDEYPSVAVEFMQQQQLKGRVFNEYVWGGYLEWNAPELKPMIDGRADVFVYKGVFDDFVKASAIRDSLNILDKYQIDYALLNPSQALTYLLQHSPDGARFILTKSAESSNTCRCPSDSTAAVHRAGESANRRIICCQPRRIHRPRKPYQGPESRGPVWRATCSLFL